VVRLAKHLVGGSGGKSLAGLVWKTVFPGKEAEGFGGGAVEKHPGTGKGPGAKVSNPGKESEREAGGEDHEKQPEKEAGRNDKANRSGEGIAGGGSRGKEPGEKTVKDKRAEQRERATECGKGKAENSESRHEEKWRLKKSKSKKEQTGSGKLTGREAESTESDAKRKSGPKERKRGLEATGEQPGSANGRAADAADTMDAENGAMTEREGGTKKQKGDFAEKDDDVKPGEEEGTGGNQGVRPEEKRTKRSLTINESYRANGMCKMMGCDCGERRKPAPKKRKVVMSDVSEDKNDTPMDDVCPEDEERESVSDSQHGGSGSESGSGSDVESDEEEGEDAAEVEVELSETLKLNYALICMKILRVDAVHQASFLVVSFAAFSDLEVR
jgi:hypothetical protein